MRLTVPCLLPRDMPTPVWELLESLMHIGVPLPHHASQAIVHRDEAGAVYEVRVEHNGVTLVAVWDVAHGEYTTGENLSDWKSVSLSLDVAGVYPQRHRPIPVTWKRAGAGRAQGPHQRPFPATWARAFNILSSPSLLHPEFVPDDLELLRYESEDGGRTWKVPFTVATGAQLDAEIEAYARGTHMDGRLVVGKGDVRILPGWRWEAAPSPGWSVRYALMKETFETSDDERWTAVQVAEYLGFSGEHASATARKTMSRWGITAVHRPDANGRPAALYPASAVRQAASERGRGDETD